MKKKIRSIIVILFLLHILHWNGVLTSKRSPFSDDHNCCASCGYFWCGSGQRCINNNDPEAYCQEPTGVTSCTMDYPGATFNLNEYKLSANNEINSKYYKVDALNKVYDSFSASSGQSLGNCSLLFNVCGNVMLAGENRYVRKCSTTSGSDLEALNFASPAFLVCEDESAWGRTDICERLGVSVSDEIDLDTIDIDDDVDISLGGGVGNLYNYFLGLIDRSDPSIGVYLRYYTGNTCRPPSSAKSYPASVEIYFLCPASESFTAEYDYNDIDPWSSKAEMFLYQDSNVFRSQIDKLGYIDSSLLYHGIGTGSDSSGSSGQVCTYQVLLPSIYGCPEECPRKHGKVCSGNGKCKHKGSTNKGELLSCVCDDGYTGKACDNYVALESFHEQMSLGIFLVVVLLLGVLWVRNSWSVHAQFEKFKKNTHSRWWVNSMKQNEWKDIFEKAVLNKRNEKNEENKENENENENEKNLENKIKKENLIRVQMLNKKLDIEMTESYTNNNINQILRNNRYDFDDDLSSDDDEVPLI